MATVDCSVANATTTDLDGLFGNGTDGNATMHCSKSEFGCCPDWVTPAEGKNNAGCPTFTLGSCNETEYGCCHDDVTLARGPNLEGCGEPIWLDSRRNNLVEIKWHYGSSNYRYLYSGRHSLANCLNLDAAQTVKRPHLEQMVLDAERIA
ncbi:hypothetical protein COOONC_22014 [Cooperia oncophora]